MRKEMKERLVGRTEENESKKEKIGDRSGRHRERGGGASVKWRREK